MTDNVVKINKRKVKLPPLPDLSEVEKLSMLRMSDRHMALLLNLSEEEFELLKEHVKDFRDAIGRGVALGCRNASTVIVMAIQGQLVGSDGKMTSAQQEQLQAAKDYLKQHSPNWRIE